MIIHLGFVFFGMLGFLISLYFTLVSYGVIKADQRFIPNICSMEEGVCQQIIHTHEARIFGLPNSVLGIIYYMIVIAMGLFQIESAASLYRLIIIVSGGTVVLGAYLSFVLIVKIRVPCVLCFTSHGINTIIFLHLISQ